MGVTDRFAATVSSEEVARGKPAPDVYLEAMRRLGDHRGRRDRGLRERHQSAHAAGLRVIAIPNPHFPPADDALALADEILPEPRRAAGMRRATFVAVLGLAASARRLLPRRATRRTSTASAATSPMVGQSAEPRGHQFQGDGSVVAIFSARRVG